MPRTLNYVASLVLAFVLVLLALPTPAAEAAGGMGSLWTTNTTASTIDLAWSISGSFAPSGATPYKICYKVSGSVEGACSGGEVRTTAQTSIPLTGLASNTTYKIKVLCRCTKNGKRAKDRKVATLTITTPPVIGDSIRVSATSRNSITVTWTYSGPSRDFGVCYKRIWNITSLDAACSFHGQFIGDAGASGPIPATSRSHTITGLTANKTYKIVVYAVSGGAPTKIGSEVKAKTTR